MPFLWLHFHRFSWRRIWGKNWKEWRAESGKQSILLLLPVDQEDKCTCLQVRLSSFVLESSLQEAVIVIWRDDIFLQSDHHHHRFVQRMGQHHCLERHKSHLRLNIITVIIIMSERVSFLCADFSFPRLLRGFASIQFVRQHLVQNHLHVLSLIPLPLTLFAHLVMIIN